MAYVGACIEDAQTAPDPDRDLRSNRELQHPWGPRGQDGSASKDELGRVSLWGLDRAFPYLVC